MSGPENSRIVRRHASPHLGLVAVIFTALFLLLFFATGEVSSINIVSSAALFLVPLTRFPVFIWLIAAGFSMPNTSGTRTQASLAHSS
jgi:hypothetical protein